MAHEIEARPGVLSASAFGAAVHVSGTDKRQLEQAIAPWKREPYRWKQVSPSLEDVFIQLMADQVDDRYAA